MFSEAIINDKIALLTSRAGYSRTSFATKVFQKYTSVLMFPEGKPREVSKS